MNDSEAIKSRVNIVEIISEKVRLKKAGANYFGLCPFHDEKSPSFSVNENIQIFKCFGCGQSGDVFAFIMKTENYEFREALEYLADKIGYKLESHKSSHNNDKFEEEEKIYKVNQYVSSFYQKKLFDGENPGIEYAKKRGLTSELINKFGIGYAGELRTELTDTLLSKNLTLNQLINYGLVTEKEGKSTDKFKNRLIFTIYNEKGKVVGFSGRYIGKDDPNYKPPKYLNSPETLVFKKSNILFGLYQAKEKIRKLNFVILSEGQMNIISSNKVGVENITASLGTSFTEAHLKLLTKYTENIYLAFDKDSAGKKAMLRTLEMCFREDINVKLINWDAKYGKDPDEVITVDPKLWIESVNNPIDPIELIYSEFEIKNKSLSLDNVNKFLKLILKIVAVHKNDIKKEFYMKYLSGKLGYTQMALTDMLKKGEYNVKPKFEAPVKQNAFLTNYQKTEINIFDRIFSLILQNWKEVKHLILALDRDYLPLEYKDLYDCLVLFSDEDDIAVVRENLDESERLVFDNLVLRDITLDELVSIEEHITKMIPRSKNEYKRKLILEWKKDPGNAKLKQEIDKVLNIKSEDILKEI